MIVNLTPHVLNIKLSDGSIVSIAPSGVVARCATEKKVVDWLTSGFHPDDVAHIVVRHTTYGDVSGVPDAKPGTIYVASMLAAQAANRADVMFPGEAIRDDKGNIVGCDGLTKP